MGLKLPVACFSEQGQRLLIKLQSSLRLPHVGADEAEVVERACLAALILILLVERQCLLEVLQRYRQLPQVRIDSTDVDPYVCLTGSLPKSMIESKRLAVQLQRSVFPAAAEK